MWHLCMELTEQRSHSLLGLPHHVAPWEQHWNVDHVHQQSFKMTSSLKDRRMERRIVRCPKCRSLLQEPPLGNPFYDCGSCSTTLQAKHATQEDIDIRLQQKALLKRMESDRKTKSGSSEDGYKVFTSESSTETLDRDEHAHSGEGSPSWSPSRLESPLYGPKTGRSSQALQQRQVVESFEKPQYYPQTVAPRAKQEFLPEKVEALGHNLRRLGVEDGGEGRYQNRAPANPEWANGHGVPRRLANMTRPRLDDSLVDKDSEAHHFEPPHVQKSFSFNHMTAVVNVSNKHTAGGDRVSSLSKDVQQATRESPSISPVMRGESGQYPMENLQLPAQHDGITQHIEDGAKSQRDMYTSPDILEYDTSDYASSIGDGDAYQAMVVENHSRPSSGELDSKVVLDHRVTRPGAYQRTSPASRGGHLNCGHHHTADGHDKYFSDGDKSSVHAQLERSQWSNMQQRATFHYPQQPPHAPHQGSTHSSPNCSYSKPAAGQNGPLLHESNLQSGAAETVTYPFLPRSDEPPYVVCQHCGQLLAVPADLPAPKKAFQKLRCGACVKISVFLMAAEEHNSAPTTSPKGSGTVADLSTVHYNQPDPAISGRHAHPGTRAEGDGADRSYPTTASAGPQRLPPSARNIPRIPSGSKLASMSSSTNGTMMPHTPASNGFSNLHPAAGSMMTRSKSSSYFSDTGSSRHTQPSAASNGEHVLYSLGPRVSSGSEHEGHHFHEGRLFHTSSESDNDSPRQRPLMSSFKGDQFFVSSRMPLDRRVAQQYSKDEGYLQEATWSSSKSLKGIIKKGVKKELTKSKQSSSTAQYRRKVIVNGSPILDVLVKRAEGLAGPIHPGSYWYDPQAGFWGLSGGPCLGIIPPHIEEFSIPLSRHCSGGQTGVVVNGRELHKSDYDLLVRRGLPPTPGMTYFIDIEGLVKDAVSGSELGGLGPLAPTLEQTRRGHGMWVPGSSKIM